MFLLFVTAFILKPRDLKQPFCYVHGIYVLEIQIECSGAHGPSSAGLKHLWESSESFTHTSGLWARATGRLEPLTGALTFGFPMWLGFLAVWLPQGLLLWWLRALSICKCFSHERETASHL